MGSHLRFGQEATRLLQVLDLRRLPELSILLPHVRVQRFDQIGWQPRGADELEYIGEILEAMGRGHARCELEFDERRKRQDAEPLAVDGHLRRIGKRDGLRQTVAGKLSRDQDIDRDAVLGIANALAARRLLDVPAPQIAIPTAVGAPRV